MSITTTLAMSTLAMSMVAVAATTGPLNILSAYADPEFKIKSWSPEGGGGSTTLCAKGPCGGINKDTRETCEEQSGGEKCKQDHLN